MYRPKQYKTCNRLAKQHFLKKKKETQEDGKVFFKLLLYSHLTEEVGGRGAGKIYLWWRICSIKFHYILIFVSDMLPVVFKKSNKKYVIQVLLLLIHFKCKYTEQICNKFKTR